MEFICVFAIIILVGWLFISVLTTDASTPEEVKPNEQAGLQETPLPRPRPLRLEDCLGPDSSPRPNKKRPSCGAGLGRKPVCDYCGDGA